MSFDDLTATWQLERMKEIIGRTRHGHEVWIEVLASNTGELEMIIPKFKTSEDNYDAFCIVEAYKRRLQASMTPRGPQMIHITDDELNEEIAERIPAGFTSEAAAMGHVTSMDRLRYGMKLLHPAYRWKQ